MQWWESLNGPHSHQAAACTQIRVFNYNSLEKAHEFEAPRFRAKTKRKYEKFDSLTRGAHRLYPLHRDPPQLAVPFVIFR